MQGSLIFVVIVAIWAAYLVQHWVRRREDAAATRSVDGFSEAMRVLQKRPLLPQTELQSPRPHSYSVTPARVSRAIVDVKRALPAGSARPFSTVSTTTTAPSPPSPVSPVLPVSPVSPLSARSGRSASMAAVRSDPMSRNSEVEPMPETRRPVRPRPESEGPSLGQRRLRAGVLLVSVLWVPVSLVLALLGRLMWLSVPFAMLTVAAVVVWLRTEAAGERARSDAGLADHEGQGHHESSPQRRSALAFAPGADDTQAVHSHVYAAASHPEQGTEVLAPVLAPAAAATTTTPAPAAVGAVGAVGAVAFFDGQAGDATAVRTAPAAPALPGTWSPVPVPRPTYSMKAKAEPRLTESGVPADVFATPEFADEADEANELDERGLFARRAVSE